MQPFAFQIGDKIGRPRFGYIHVGIYVGNDRVIHNDKGGGVVLSTFEQFADGGSVVLQKRVTDNYFQQLEIAHRAFSLLGTRFNLIHFNCEHAANWAQTGQKESGQLQGLAFVVGLVLFGLALSKGA